MTAARGDSIGCSSIVVGLVLMMIVAAIGKCVELDGRPHAPSASARGERSAPAKDADTITLTVECNIRAEPSERGEILARGLPGAPLPILDRRGGWRKITHAGVIGWIGPACHKP